MGMLTLVSFMNDLNQQPKLDSYKTLPFFAYYILPLIFFPFLFVKTVYKGVTCKGDPDMYPFSLKKNRQTFKKVYLESKTYDLDDLRRCYSKYNRKLNDYMYGSISAAFSKYFTELGIHKQTHFTCSVPVNMKPPPKTIDDVQFDN